MEKTKVVLFLFVLISGCASATSNTWILPKVDTHPDERKVADRHPVIPVEIKILD